MARSRVNLKDLIDAGLLQPDEVLTCEPRKGERYTAHLQLDGSILFNGSTFKSSSGWAFHVAQNQRDGWRDVYARARPLDDFRSQLTNSMKQSVTPQIRTVDNAKDHLASFRSELSPVMGESSLQTGHQEIYSVTDDDKEEGVKKSLFKRILELSPTEFERPVGEFLRTQGFSNVNVTGRTGDGGIDGDCEMPFINLKVAYQAKRYGQDNTIGSPAIRNFKGGVVGRYDRGVFITTSSFTVGAVEEAKEPGVTIVLIDGLELVQQMAELGLGVKTVPVVMQEVDQVFFTKLEG